MDAKFSKTIEELKEIAKSSINETRADIFQVDPRLLVVVGNHNVRDFETDRVKRHIEELRDNIRENGVMTPLECRRGEKIGTYKDDKGKEHDLYYYIITDGECRKRAVDMLIEEGVPFARVPVIMEKKGSNEANRVLDMLNANIGLRFTPIELAEAYSRFLSFGWEVKEIAKKVGKKTQFVNECLDLLNYNETVQRGLIVGKITANNVRKIEKKLKNIDIDPEARQKEIQKRLVSAINRADSEGTKKAGKYIDMEEQKVEEKNTFNQKIKDNFIRTYKYLSGKPFEKVELYQTNDEGIDEVVEIDKIDWNKNVSLHVVMLCVK